jgi:hypothetical protein
VFGMVCDSPWAFNAKARLVAGLFGISLYNYCSELGIVNMPKSLRWKWFGLLGLGFILGGWG